MIKRSLLILTSIIVIPILGGCTPKGQKELNTAGFLETDYHFQEAADSYEKVIAVNSELLDAHIGLINCDFQLGNGEAIVKKYKELQAKNPNDPVYLFTYGYALLRMGEVDTALELFQQAISKGLKKGIIYYNIARIYKIRGDDVKAKEFLKKASDKGYGDAYFALASYENNEKGAVRLMKQGLKHIIDKGSGYLSFGRFYLAKKNEKEANLWLRKADEWGRDNGIRYYQNIQLVYPLVYEADMLASQTLFDNAIEKYKEAIKTKDDWADAHTGLAGAYYRKRSYNLALEECKRALELMPNDVGAYNIMALIFEDKNQYDIAESYYKKEMTIDPVNMQYGNFAILYESQGKYDEALGIVNKGLKINPNDAHENFIKGDIFKYKKDYDKAIESYKKAEEIGLGDDYLNSLLYVDLATTYLYKDAQNHTIPVETKKLCLSYLQKAINANPRDKDAQKWFEIISKYKTREEK